MGGRSAGSWCGLPVRRPASSSLAPMGRDRPRRSGTRRRAGSASSSGSTTSTPSTSGCARRASSSSARHATSPTDASPCSSTSPATDGTSSAPADLPSAGARRLTDEEREAPPTPGAVDLHEPSGAHPTELGFDLGEYVLGIAAGPADATVELLVELGRGALDDLQVGEDASRPQDRRDLAEQPAAAAAEVEHALDGHREGFD